MKPYVYIYVDPSKPARVQCSELSLLYEPFYVGKGTHNRWTWLLNAVPVDLNRLLKWKLKTVTAPDVVRIECGTEEEAFDLEQRLTRAIGLVIEKCGTLCNMRHGGEGGFSLSDEAKSNLRAKNTGANNPNFGKTWSEERRAKHTATMAKRKEDGRNDVFRRTIQLAQEAHRKNYKITKANGEVEFIRGLPLYAKANGLPLTGLKLCLKTGQPYKTKPGSSRMSRIEGWQVAYV